MTKCGKSVLPECKYFTTGGCTSPFMCFYQIKNVEYKTEKGEKEMTNLQAPWIGHPADEEEREPVYFCEWCDRPILEGEDYYDMDGTKVCEDCISNCRKTA